jgi:hypothetical protein
LRQTKVQPLLSTAFHPQTNGQTKRINQILEQYLRVFVDYLQDDWYDLLPLAEFSYNNSSPAPTAQTPFYATHGFHSRSDFTPIDSPVPAAKDFIKQIHDTQALAKVALEEARKRYAKNADAKRNDARTSKPGDVVRLSRCNLAARRPTDKLDDRYLGPIEVIKQINPVTYRLKLPPQMQIYDVFHVALLEPWHKNTFPSREPDAPPEPDEIDGEKAYVVSKILDSKVTRGQLQYLVSWEGYDASSNEWVDANDFHDDEVLGLDYHGTYPDRPDTAQRRKIVRSRSQGRG